MDDAQKNFVKASLTEYIHQHGENCWFCDTSIHTKNIPANNWCVIFPMHKKISSKKISPTQRRKIWNELDIYIPACSSCRRRFKGYRLATYLIFFLTSLIPIAIIVTRQDYLLFLFLPIFFIYPFFLQLFYRLYTYLVQIGLRNKVADYNQVKLLRSQGWEYSQITG